MKLTSSSFDENSFMKPKYTADGENLCPDFYISDVPENTRQLILLCHDPDATAGIPWVHWFVSGIPGSTKQIMSGKVPAEASEHINSFGTRGYGGPSPSSGSGPHRYVFSLLALSENTNLDTNKQMSYREILDTLNPLLLAETSYTGIYERV